MKWATVSNKGIQGRAKVRLSEDKKKVQVKFLDGEKTYTLLKKNCPDVVLTGEFYVSLDAKGEKMYRISPQNGMFAVKVVEFAAKEGEEPAPQLFRGDGYDYQFFNAILEIQEGKLKGMHITMRLRYAFLEREEEINGKQVSVCGLPKTVKANSAVSMLIDFLEATKAAETPLKFSDNVLPALQKRVVKNNQTFSVVLKDGFVTTIYQAADDEDTDETEEEEEEAPKKSAKKPILKGVPTEEPEDEEPGEQDVEPDEETGEVPWDDVEEDEE